MGATLKICKTLFNSYLNNDAIIIKCVYGYNSSSSSSFIDSTMVQNLHSIYIYTSNLNF